MLASLAFLAFWIVVGLLLFFIALRGGPRGARAALQSQTRTSRRVAAVFFAVLYIGLGVAVPLAIAIGNHDHGAADVGGASVSLTAQEQQGRAIFGERCASCHTLAGARADGKVGPNLDGKLRGIPNAKPFVLDAIENGRQQGKGTMPANIVQGRDAAAVAAFVARVAGRE